MRNRERRRRTLESGAFGGKRGAALARNPLRAASGARHARGDRPRPVAHIRPAGMTDYDGISSLLAEADLLHNTALPGVFRLPDEPARSREYIGDLLATENACFMVAEVEGEIVGVAQATILETSAIPKLIPRRFALVNDVVVTRRFRRCGIGRALMEHVQQWAHEQGVNQTELTIYEFNRAALSFYRKLGYRTASRRLRKTLD